jgi:hypothetical protein
LIIKLRLNISFLVSQNPILETLFNNTKASKRMVSKIYYCHKLSIFMYHKSPASCLPITITITEKRGEHTNCLNHALDPYKKKLTRPHKQGLYHASAIRLLEACLQFS